MHTFGVAIAQCLHVVSFRMGGVVAFGGFHQAGVGLAQTTTSVDLSAGARKSHADFTPT